MLYLQNLLIYYFSFTSLLWRIIRAIASYYKTKQLFNNNNKLKEKKFFSSSYITETNVTRVIFVFL